MKYLKKLIALVQDWFAQRHDEKEMKRLKSLGPVVTNQIFKFHRPISTSEFWIEVDQIHSCLFILKPSNSFENKHEYFLKISETNDVMEHLLLHTNVFKTEVQVEYIILFEHSDTGGIYRRFRNNAVYPYIYNDIGIKI